MAVTPSILVVFGLVLVTLVLFVTEPVPADTVALGVLVALLLLEPVTRLLTDAGLLAGPIQLVTVEQGLSGFANAATLTVLAMFVLSEGVRRTGIVARLGEWVQSLTGDAESRQLGATIGLVAPISGIVNNTAAVAILLPMVSEVAERGGTSPSKLLLPLSYASMVGGTLTLIGTSTNVLASDLYARLAPAAVARQFGMFEFTGLGVVLLAVGTGYLLTVGRWLTPERIEPRGKLTDEYEIGEYLTEVVVAEDSALVGQRVADALRDTQYDLDVVQLIRDGRSFLEPLGAKQIRAGDVFALRTDRDTLVELTAAEGLELVPDATVDDAELETAESGQNLVEVVIAPGTELVGESLASVAFRQTYGATVLAIRRGGDVVRERLDRMELRPGDTLLIEASVESVGRLDDSREFIVVGEASDGAARREKTPVAVAIVGAVVGLAALGVAPIVVTALAGSLAMVVTGCLDPNEVYEAVHWDVIFLLAGVIPLGIALQTSGAAALLAGLVVEAAAVLPPLGVLALFYVVTAALTNVVSNNASVVLMIPVAIQTAVELGTDPLAFAMSVTFAASTAFVTPVGYQTNLFVYGPGGYEFSDYVRVGGPLQLLFAVVTPIGVQFFFG
ncbi:SLC13 family permease [Halobaculum sp. MBLA0147]|uniref:SLC13 family permease n=1 Tax=Halobaculum sp. MBLA0147 TaxID=3079934 RepID=UPI003525AA91